MTTDNEALRQAVAEVSARFYGMALPEPEEDGEPDPVTATLAAIVAGWLDALPPGRAAAFLRWLGREAAADE